MGKVAEEFRAKRRERELHTCKHFNGIMNQECLAGVNLRDRRYVPPTGMAQWPCVDPQCPTQCSKREYPTREEVEAEERAREEGFQHYAKARQAITATKLNAGTVDCPKCGGKDALRFSISSYNGHCHGACSTKGCLAWME